MAVTGVAVGLAVMSTAATAPDAGATAPRHLQLSYSGEVDIVVTFNTAAVTLASVEWWPANGSNATRQTAAAAATLFNLTGTTDDYIAWIHRVTLHDLASGAEYSYRVGSEAGGWSPTRTFRCSVHGGGVINSNTTTAPGSPLMFLAIADLSGDAIDGGFGGVARALASEVVGGQYDIVLHAGDIAYDLHTDKGAVGDAFMADVEAVASRVPYLVAPGNHEAFGDFAHFRNRFTTPGFEDNGNLWWSLDLGPVHFVSYNTEAYFDGPVNATMAQQYSWLEADLAAAGRNRQRVPWIVAMGHRPFYCNVAGSAADGTPQCDGEQEQSRLGPEGVDGGRPFSVEALFHTHGVDLALFGHVHDYSRFYPVFNHTVMNGSAAEPFVDPRATVYLTIGGAGNPEMPQPPKNKCTSWDEGCTPIRWSPWSVCESGYYPKCPNFNFGRAVVHNSTHLEWQQLTVTAPGVTRNGTVVKNATVVSPTVMDSVMIVQRNHGPFV
jgi:hypothetical protein